MSIPTDYKLKYKENLSELISNWGQYRKARDKLSLQEFYHTCNQLSQEIATFTLYALQQVVKSMSTAAQQGIDDQKEVNELIKEIDWLMNQLIRGNQEAKDPFLIEGENAFDDTYLAQQVSAHASRIRRIKHPNIVIIDDQLSVAQALSKTLEDFALVPSYFTSIAGFEKVQKTLDVDLILLDIVMPGVNQEEVFDFAKRMVKKGIKVISCSSTFTFETRLLAVRANVSDFIVKPVNTYLLVEKIGRALGLQNHVKYNIVIVDDQETMGTFYKTMLEQVGCNVTFFPSAEALFAEIDDLVPDMFLLDMMMPDVDGFEVAKMLRHEHKFDFAPILFLTSDTEVENRLCAIDNGADDVICKAEPIKMIQRQLITRLKRASQVRSFVAKDPLTGVLNHGQIVESANHVIRSSSRREKSVALAVIDVDHFKRVNDTQGHIVGDKVLCALGQLLTNSVRETDLVGRYGGEEFVIIFEDCDIDDAANKIQLIKDVFSNMSFFGEKEKFKVTFSAGVIDLDKFDSIMPAIAFADKALYKAKDEGRNKVIKYKKRAKV